METLKKGTILQMNGRSDFMFLRHKDLETKEIIKTNFYDDLEKAIEGRKVKEMCAVSDYIPHEAELVEDIPYLDDYTGTNHRLVIKVGDRIIELGIVVEFHIYDKMELNKKVKEKISEYLEGLRKRVDIDEALNSVKEDEKTGNIKTEDGVIHYFDFIKIVS